jgi:hypothetical protein
MLDGFDFSEEYGEGVLTERKDTTTSRTTGMPAPARSQDGLAALPDGFVTGEKEAALDDSVFAGADGVDVGDLSDMVRTAGHITDLSWLELAEQDPDRLPTQHNDKALQGVVEAWGVNRRTDGVEVIPNVVVPPPPRSQVALLPGDQYREVVASAMRKSAFGVPFDNIVADVAAHLGPAIEHVATEPRLQKLAAAIRQIKAEQGIAGQVFLRDAAFPGLLSGKWDAAIRRKCANAHYWLTRPGSKLAAYENYLGKRVVASIPWDEALDYYRSTLEVIGRRLASGDPKTVLIAALRQEAQKRDREATVIPHSPQAQEQRLELKKAWEALATAPLPTRQIIQKDTVRVSLEQARAKMASWVGAGLLSEGAAREILTRSGETPENMLRAGAKVIASTARREAYEGHGTKVKVPLRMATRTGEWAAQETVRVASVMADRATRQVRAKVEALFRGWVKTGSIETKMADALLASNATNEELLVLGSRLAERIPQQAKYAGEGVGAKTPVRMAHDGSKAVRDQAEMNTALEARTKAAARQRVETAFGKWVTAGLITEAQARGIMAKDAPVVDLLREGARLASASVVKKAEYHGEGEETHVHTGHRETLVASDTRPVLRYAMTAMNEGAAGNDLDVMLASRFSQDYLKNAGEPLVLIRRKHEGLAGHVYVAAEAYASPVGTTGCDKGALIHRANQIKAVLQMDRCATCAANTQGSCQKYGKILVASAPVKDPAKYQRETIRLANADESEKTAAMFNNYDPGEFGLQNDALDTFDFDNLPANETLSGVLFEGMVLPEE